MKRSDGTMGKIPFWSHRFQMIAFFLFPLGAFLQFAFAGFWQTIVFGLIPCAVIGWLSIGWIKPTRKIWIRNLPAILIAAVGFSGLVFLSFGGSFAPDIFEADMTYGMISFLLLLAGMHVRGWILFLEWAFRHR